MKIYYNVLIGIEDDKELKIIATFPFYEKQRSKALKAYHKLKVSSPFFYKELVENTFKGVGDKTEVTVKILRTSRRAIVAAMNPQVN